MAADTTAQDTGLVSRREAAELAEVHVNTVRLWEEHGYRGLPLHVVKRENGRVMIPMSELEAIVRERRSSGGGDEVRLAEALAENKMLRSENEMLKEHIAELRRDHRELLETVRELIKEGGASRK